MDSLWSECIRKRRAGEKRELVRVGVIVHGGPGMQGEQSMKEEILRCEEEDIRKRNARRE